MDNPNCSPYSSLTIATWNANGIRPKKAEIELFLEELQVDIFLVCETMLKVSDSFNFPGYRSFHRYRTGRPGGGVAIFSRNCISSQKIDFDTTVEAIGIATEVEGVRRVFVAVYNPPSSIVSPEDFNKLTAHPSTIIGGDLNAKDPSWGSRCSNPAGIHLRRLRDSLPKTCIYGPEDATHIPISNNCRGDVLDIFITHDCEPLRRVKTVYQLSSDHFPVIAECGKLESQPVSVINTNWITYSWHMQQIQCPSDTLSCEDIEKEATRLSSAIQSAIQNSSKEVVLTSRNRLGLTSEERALIRNKNHLKTRWSRYRNPNDRMQLNRLQAQVKLMLKEKKAEKWRQYIECANDEDQRFWSLLRSLHRRKDPNAPLRVDSHLIFNDQDKAEATADFFETQFTNNLPENPNIARKVKSSFATIHTSQIGKTFLPTNFESISNKIKVLSNKKAPGVDGIPNRAIRLLPKPVIQCLVRLFNAILQYGVFPKIWKHSILITIPKKSKDPTKLNNRRPISLLPGLAKLCESVIKDQLQDFAEDHGILSANQFGFRSRLAAVHKAAHLAALVEANDRPRRKVIAVLLDVAKAYDRVWKDGLLHKMVHLNFPPNLCRLISSWISNRSFAVKVGSKLSSIRLAREGLPQGSALSPLLFNIYVYDMPSFHNNRHLWSLQFADDTALVAVGLNFDSTRNKILLGMTQVSKFANLWKIEINRSKTEAILFGRSRPPENFIRFEGQKIKLSSAVTYLGIIFDRNLTFQKHAECRKKLALLRLRQLHAVLNPNSGLDNRNRLRIANYIALPTAIYGQEVWVTGSLKASKILTTAQNIIYRKCLAAYRYLPNDELRDEVKAVDLREQAWEMRRKMIERLLDHPRDDVIAIGRYIEEVGPLG